MELQEKMFIRTKTGCICKLININDFREPSMKYGVEANYLKDIMFIGDDDILKASHNIIDLIEVGDYVNGLKVTKLDFDKLLLNCKTIECHQEDLSNGYEGVTFVYTNKDIKTIVTKEQFESMAYKIGD